MYWVLSAILFCVGAYAQTLGTPGQWQGAGSPTVPCVPGQVYYQTDAVPPASDMWRCNASSVWFQPASAFVNTGGSYSNPSWLTALAASKLTATGTPSASTYLRGDYSWATIAGGGTWGSITGTLADQTDLQTALNGKLATSGNAASASVLQTPRAINGTNFDGSAPITITASLPSNPTGCTDQFVQDIAADGTLTCVTVPYAQISGTPTLAAIATSGSASDLSVGTVATARLGSGTANSTTYLNGSNAWSTPTGVVGTRVYLASPVTNNNAVANTIADVTGLSFAVTSGLRYKFRFYIQYTSAATTTGSRWTINGPATTELTYGSVYTLTATSQTTNFAVAYDIPAASNASSLTAGNVAVIEGIVKPSSNGTLTARFASEVAGSAIVALAGRSYVEYEVIP